MSESKEETPLKKREEMLADPSKKERVKMSSDNTPEGKKQSYALIVAARVGARVRGLLLTRPHDKSLLLLSCRDIHTVGMRHAIDVAFINREGVVVESHCAVGPLRRLKNCRAVAVVERFSSCETPWFCVGEQLMITSEKGVEL